MQFIVAKLKDKYRIYPEIEHVYKTFDEMVAALREKFEVNEIKPVVHVERFCECRHKFEHHASNGCKSTVFLTQAGTRHLCQCSEFVKRK